jgi:hypothetical protein
MVSQSYGQGVTHSYEKIEKYNAARRNFTGTVFFAPLAPFAPLSGGTSPL